MERQLILALAIATTVGGTTLAVLRPTTYRLGQEGTPQASSGVTYRGSVRQGRWRSSTPPRDWEGFQGRGPAGVK
ncbi:MAG: hypothetical protein RLZZ124_1088 [Cyanobacteriota bacterium]|jgi:hypothetical protein